jgi:hypothetical protein
VTLSFGTQNWRSWSWVAKWLVSSRPTLASNRLAGDNSLYIITVFTKFRDLSRVAFRAFTDFLSVESKSLYAIKRSIILYDLRVISIEKSPSLSWQQWRRSIKIAALTVRLISLWCTEIRKTPGRGCDNKFSTPLDSAVSLFSHWKLNLIQLKWRNVFRKSLKTFSEISSGHKPRFLDSRVWFMMIYGQVKFSPVKAAVAIMIFFSILSLIVVTFAHTLQGVQRAILLYN